MQIKGVDINNARKRLGVIFMHGNISVCDFEFHSQAVDVIDVLFSLRLGTAFPEGFLGLVSFRNN